MRVPILGDVDGWVSIAKIGWCLQRAIPLLGAGCCRLSGRRLPRADTGASFARDVARAIGCSELDRCPRHRLPVEPVTRRYVVERRPCRVATGSFPNVLSRETLPLLAAAPSERIFRPRRRTEPSSPAAVIAKSVIEVSNGLFQCHNNVVVNTSGCTADVLFPPAQCIVLAKPLSGSSRLRRNRAGRKTTLNATIATTRGVRRSTTTMSTPCFSPRRHPACGR